MHSRDLNPYSLRPMLLTGAKQAPVGDRWIHEIKYDGYRMTRIDYIVEYAEGISERTQEGLFRERMVKVAALAVPSR